MFKSIVTKITLIFICLCIIPISLLIFIFVQQSRHLTETSMNDSLQKLVDEKANAVTLELSMIERETQNMALWVSASFKNPAPHELSPECIRDSRGIWSKKSTEVSNICIMPDTPLNGSIIHDINSTEGLDYVFRDAMVKNKNIEWIYFITEDNFLRVYPYVNNDVYQLNHDHRTDVFYTVATEENNPGGNAVWTKPYFDYAGRGWIITCSQPIYVNGELKAVVCIDVTLKTLENLLSDFKLAQSGYAFLIDNAANIIYHPNYLPPESQQGELLPGNLLNLGVSEKYIRIVDDMILQKKEVAQYYDKNDGKTKLVAFTPIKKLHWTIGIEVNKEDYLLGIDRFAQGFIVVGIIVLLSTLGFGVYIFLRVSKPILQLSKEVKSISSSNFLNDVHIKSNDEIGVLAQSFNSMGKKIRDYTSDIIRSKHQLETVFNSIGGILMICTPDYKIKMLNCHGVSQMKDQTVDYSDAPCYKVLYGLDRPCEDCALSEAVTAGRDTYAEILNGNDVYHSWFYPILNDREQIQEVIVYSQKVTEQVLLEQEIIQTEKLASIGQLAAGISHELKNPLSVIKGVAYLLNTSIAEGNKQLVDESLEEIDASVKRAENIIYNLLDFSRTSKEKNTYIDVRGLIEQLLLLEGKLIVNQKIETVIELDPDPLLIYGQMDSVKHIFINIITNSIQAMQNGGILSVIGRVIHTPAGPKARLVFKDTGCGIPEEWKDKIFEPFFTTKEAGSGTGLGLWIARREAMKMGGEITLEINPEKETAFVLVMPVDKKEVDAGD